MSLTYIQALDVAINAITDEEAKEKLTALKTQMSKKHTSSKPTKVQVENEAVKAEIFDVLSATDKPLRVGEICSLMPREISSQKASALLRQMVEAGTVAKTVDKKVSTFALR